jgi:hypothetical protein
VTTQYTVSYIPLIINHAFLFCSTYLLHELTSTSTNTFMSAQLWIWRSIIISNDSSFQINHTHHMYLFWEDILSIGIYLQWHLNHSFWCSALFTLLKINEWYKFELDSLQWIFHCRGSVCCEFGKCQILYSWGVFGKSNKLAYSLLD